jgi:hypothetical protein
MKTLFVSVMLLKASLYKNKKEYFTYFGGRQGQTSTQSGSINGNIPLPRGGAVPYRRPPSVTPLAIYNPRHLYT